MLMTSVLKQIQEVASASSKTEKIARLKANNSPLLRSLLFIAFSPTVVLGLGSSWCDPDNDDIPFDPATAAEPSELITLSNQITDRQVKGNAAKEAAAALVARVEPQFRWIAAGILSGKLRIGCDAKLLNKALPGLIPTLDIMLAEEFHPGHAHYPALASPKLDGMRCLAVVTSAGVRLFSRGGKPIDAVPHIEAALKKLPNGYYDGELLHPSGFQRTVSVCRAKEPKPGHDAVTYHIFDYIHPEEWEEPKTNAKARFNYLKQVLESRDLPALALVEHTQVKSNRELLRLHKEFIAKGYEGTMVQWDEPYKRRRGWHLQKLKDFLSSEGVVIGVTPGTGKYKGMMGSLRLRDLKTQNEFDLGSGFTDEDRQHPDAYWMSRVIEYRYQELTEDQIPRFPTYLRIRGDMR